MREVLAAVAGIFGQQDEIAPVAADVIEIVLDAEDAGTVVPRGAEPVILALAADDLGLERGIAAKILDVDPGLRDTAVVRLQCAVGLWQQARRMAGAPEPAETKIDITEIARPADGVGDVIPFRPARIACALGDAKARPLARRQRRIFILDKIDGHQVELSGAERPGHPRHRSTAFLASHQAAAEIAAVDDIDRVVAFDLAPEQDGVADKNIGVADACGDVGLTKIDQPAAACAAADPRLQQHLGFIAIDDQLGLCLEMGKAVLLPGMGSRLGIPACLKRDLAAVLDTDLGGCR